MDEGEDEVSVHDENATQKILSEQQGHEESAACSVALVTDVLPAILSFRVSLVFPAMIL